MRKTMAAMTLAALCVCPALCGAAEKGIPDLVGTWEVQSEGGLVVRTGGPGAKTHHVTEFSSITAEAVFVKQQGRVVHGTFKTPKATEKLVGVIAPDNRSVHLADDDGFVDLKIVVKDKMTSVYRHTTQKDSVAALGIWTRKK